MKKLFLFFCTVFFAVSFTCTFASAKGPQGGGQTGGGGGSASAPDYGDLVVIDRNVDGVPILSANGCIQPLDINGALIPLDADCEMLPGYTPVEVDFGRLNIARSPDSVIQNRLDEVITYIKTSKAVSVDPAGRLMLEMEVLNVETNQLETYFKTIDAPLECLALYVQVMKYGHLQTAANVISSDRGDETTYRPYLDPVVDYPKFSAEVTFLLPTIPGSTVAEMPTNQDMIYSSFFLAGAGDKTGKITVDLVQYMNTILGIPSAVNALPGNPNYVNFRSYSYQRGLYFEKNVAVIQPDATPGTWKETVIPLMSWLSYSNGAQTSVGNIADFVKSGNDSLQTIVFLHNYEIPVHLW